MNKISNYEELMLEKSRLKQHLVMQKLEVSAEISAIKERLEPITRVLTFLGVYKKKEAPTAAPSTTSSLIKMGANAGFAIAGQTILAKAGWVARLVIPLLLSGISSTVIDKVRKKFHFNGRSNNRALKN